MARTDYNETLDILDGVTVSVADGIVTVKGQKGEIVKNCKSRGVVITADDKHVTLEAKQGTQVQKNMLFTNKAHIKNMMQGVTEGYLYKLKICSGHFPMSVAVKGDTFEIKNFIGEKVPRVLKIKEGADVKINGDIIEVAATNKEVAGQVAADIEKLTRRAGFDKRIFQDGIYITEKAGKAM